MVIPIVVGRVVSETTPPEDTLTSWKEIASYLGRSVRTVRRWEATEGLPVRRHLHQKASTVFAQRADIDQWQKARQAGLHHAAPEGTGAPAEDAAEVSRLEPIRRALAAAALVTLGLATGWFARGWVESQNPSKADSASQGAENLESVLNRALERDIVDGVMQLCQENQLDGECLMLRESVAQLRPDSFRANYEAAYALAAHGADLERASTYAERAGELLTDRVVSEDAEAAAWVLLFKARRHWANGAAKASLESAAELEETLASWPPRLRNLLARDFGTLALGLGQTETARTWFERISDPDYQHEMLAWHLFGAGKGPELKRHLREKIDYREPFTAVLLAMVGEHERARQVIDRAEGGRLSPELTGLARGAILFFEGKVDEATAELESAFEGLEGSGDPLYFAGSDILAMARHKRGDLEQAIGALEMTTRQRDRAMFASAGLLWVKCQSRLSSYYQEAGLDGERRATDDELKARLRFADQAFPVLADISGRGRSG